jgi:hypothetical protein
MSFLSNTTDSAIPVCTKRCKAAKLGVHVVKLIEDELLRQIKI